jgi:hypothetical protein
MRGRDRQRADTDQIARVAEDPDLVAWEIGLIDVARALNQHPLIFRSKAKVQGKGRVAENSKDMSCKLTIWPRSCRF